MASNLILNRNSQEFPKYKKFEDGAVWETFFSEIISTHFPQRM
jgi:hypothetical protein